jgi:ATPase subunit of ABC transporter with duplicated ATPase domains
MASLSGGEKRLTELVRVMHSGATLALIDEPTNHMDYVAKARFMGWLEQTKMALLVITHDRDVLEHVDRIVELKDGGLQSFAGNYQAYLKQNSLETITGISQYEVAQRTLDRLHKQILYARKMKPSWGGTADKKNPFVVMEERLTKEYNRLKAEIGRPSFWIDRESQAGMQKKLVEKYDQYKARNIRIRMEGAASHAQVLVSVEGLSLGYEHALFSNLSFEVRTGDSLLIRGRNGAGKSTLAGAIIRSAGGQDISTPIHSGAIKIKNKVRLGVYYQEIEPDLLDRPLGEAVMDAYHERGKALGLEQANSLLAQYLFDPSADGRLPLAKLSGGQKARFQIIRMLAADPNIVILDEPTNHLDLPSIEELEAALLGYAGAIVYISHDEHFIERIGGEVIALHG